MTYGKGERPEKGKNKAIAEWQLGHDRVDYVLFVGLTPIAIVEAKKKNKDVSGKIEQAERYASKFNIEPPLTPAWEISQESPYSWKIAKIHLLYRLYSQPMVDRILSN